MSSVSNPRIEVKDAARAGWFGGREEAQVPVRAPHGGAPAAPAAPAAPVGATADERATRRWPRVGLRALRDVAIVLAAIMTYTIGMITWSSSRMFEQAASIGSGSGKILAAESSRPFALPKDPSITPADAGRAFAELQPERSGGAAFRQQSVVHLERPWAPPSALPGDLFRSARPTSFGGPDDRKILEAVANGFSPAEMAYLERLAHAPAWRAFDLVARAPAVDLIGGRFRLPFGPDATPDEMPLLNFAGTKELAYASVSRAAYHMAIGQRDSAEAALRAIISVGFALVDNGSSQIDQLVGRVMVGIGRDGLERFYVITNDPHAANVIAARPPDTHAADQSANRNARSEGGDRPVAVDLRREMLTRATNERELRGTRFESLYYLSWSSCANVRDLLFGARPDVSDAFARAKHDLARFPSERAFIDVIQRWPKRLTARDPSRNALWRFPYMYGASTLVEMVLNNPRVAACTRMLAEQNALP